MRESNYTDFLDPFLFLIYYTLSLIILHFFPYLDIERGVCGRCGRSRSKSLLPKDLSGQDRRGPHRDVVNHVCLTVSNKRGVCSVVY